jgi:hypothetical protein
MWFPELLRRARLLLAPVAQPSRQGKDRAGEQERAIYALQQLGGTVFVAGHLPGQPVVRVDLRDRHLFEPELAHLQALPELQTLDLSGTPVSPAGMAHLSRLTRLQELHVCTTDAGLLPLKGLTGLRKLYLEGPKWTDAERAAVELMEAHFGMLPEVLRRAGGVTDLAHLDLSRWEITDAGLAQLKGLRTLEELGLRRTAVTDAGIDDLRKALPILRINR